MRKSQGQYGWSNGTEGEASHVSREAEEAGSQNGDDRESHDKGFGLCTQNTNKLGRILG